MAACGLVIGFLLPAVARFTTRIHQGYIAQQHHQGRIQQRGAHAAGSHGVGDQSGFVDLDLPETPEQGHVRLGDHGEDREQPMKLPFTGAAFACLFLMGGFSLLGKNLLNIPEPAANSTPKPLSTLAIPSPRMPAAKPTL